MENQNANSGVPNIENHLVLAVLTTLFCCMPFGIISLVYAVQVNISSNSGNFEMAEFSSEKALFWGMVALWCGVALYILNSLFFLLPLAFAAIANLTQI